ncbi:MAG: Tad domain-containing protein [Anaerolineales bacterium]|nr:Tad domain-containing protein [Anaerolineales bacterium]
MSPKKHEKGQALVIIVVAIIGLIGITGLAVDGGRTFVDRQGAQTSSDSAVLGVALAKIKNDQQTTPLIGTALTNYLTNTAKAIAGTNGYASDTVTVETKTTTAGSLTTAPFTGCNGTTSTYTDTATTTSTYIQVKIVTNVDTSFAKLVGINQMSNCVESIARAKPGTAGGLFDGNAVVTLSKTASPAIKANGNAGVTLTGGGMFSNSSASGSSCSQKSVWINETDITAPGITSVGSVCNDSAIPVVTGAAQYNITSDYFSFIPAPPAKPTCAAAAPAATVSGSVTTYHPGNYTASVSNSGTVILEAGTYCFTNGATFSGTVTGQGTVKIVLSGTAVGDKLEVGGVNNWNDLEIYADKVGLKVASGGLLIANRLRFYGASGTYGTANVDMIGTSTMDVNDAYFYFEGGVMDWNGNTTLNLQAPTSGDYKGLLVYMPLGNTGSPPAYKVNGNTSTYTTGTWLMPSVDLGTNGNSSMNSLHSQFVVNTITFNGNCDFKVDYDASENAGSPTSPTIELVK